MENQYNSNGETEEVSSGRVPVSKDNHIYYVGEDLRDFGRKHQERLPSLRIKSLKLK